LRKKNENKATQIGLVVTRKVLVATGINFNDWIHVIKCAARQIPEIAVRESTRKEIF
jgi:hypothetical protein